MEALLNETQVGEKLQVSLACLRRWRLIGEGPEYKKVGPLVRYRPEAVAQWLEKQPSGGDGHRFEPGKNHPPGPLVSGTAKRSPARQPQAWSTQLRPPERKFD